MKKYLITALLIFLVLVLGSYTYLFQTSNIIAKGYISVNLYQSPHPILALGDEVTEQRTRASKTYWLGGNKYSLDATIGSVHFQDGSGDWQNIDNSWWPANAPWDWEMRYADYQTKVLADFTAGQVIRFESKGESVAFQPMALEWTNNLDQIQQISMPQKVTVSLSNEPTELLPNVPNSIGKIRWDNGYGNGRHFEWENTPSRLIKILQIDSLSNLPTPPQFIIDGGNPVLRLNLIFSPSAGVDIYVNGQKWDWKTKVQTFDVIRFDKKTGGNVWNFTPLLYWDTEGNQGQSISTLEKRGNNLYVSIRVPHSWLQSATYPVFIDQTVEVFPNNYRYFHAEAWNGDLKWLTSDVDGVSPSSSYVVTNSVGNLLIQGFQSEAISETSLSAGHWGFYLWLNHNGSTLVTEAFVEVRKNNSSGTLLATSTNTLTLTTTETEYYVYLDFPQTSWTSGDTVWVGVYASVTTKQNGKRVYFYYDHSTRLSRTIDPTLDLQVGQSSDDTYRRLTPDWWNLTATRIIVGSYYFIGQQEQQGGGMRFTAVTVPQGATIDQAYLRLRAGASENTTIVRSRISAEDVDDAPTFADDAGAFDTRWAGRTTARVDWDNIAVWTVNTDYNSPEIKTVIKEIVDRAGWTSGNDIVIFWDDFDGRSDLDSTERRAYSYDGSTTYAPKLHIEYTTAGADISNTPASYNFGVLAESSNASTGLSYFTVTNNSGGSVNITIQGTDMVGGNTWVLTDNGSSGDMKVGFMAGLEGTSYNITVKKNSPYNLLLSGLGISANQSWGLLVNSPYNYTDGIGKSGNVTLTAALE